MNTDNPLLQPWTSPYGLPPFAATRAEHFVPAFELAMQAHLEEMDAIGNAAEAPSFENTVAALDRAGRLLDRIGGMFHNLTSSETSPALQAVERKMAPLLAAHDSKLYMHRFSRASTRCMASFKSSA
jgi:peptidyl-dipeptidase Dcp